MNFKWFMHGLNSTAQSSNVAVDEVYRQDELPVQIALAGGQRRFNNAAYEAEAEANKKLAEEKRERRRVVNAAAMVAADRIAICRTIAFIEKYLREGVEPATVFKEAEIVRRKEFDQLAEDHDRMNRLRGAVEDMPTDAVEAKRLLVNDRPLLDRSFNVPRRPR